MKRAVIAAVAAIAIGTGFVVSVALPAIAAKHGPTYTTVNVDTNSYTGDTNSPQAVAQCPDGSVVTGGGISLHAIGQQVVENRPEPGGTAWFASFVFGPVGQTATVYARCVSP